MNKYECKFFSNGRVVFVKEEDIENAIHAHKELLVICNSWSGGEAVRIGADEMDDPDFGKGWSMYSYKIKDTEFTEEELKKFYKVIISSGEKIMMQTGDEATYGNSGIFIDWYTKYNDYKRRNYNTNVTEKKFDELREKVDTQFTIRMMGGETEEDKKEKLRCLSGYATGIDWAGTEYERMY